jgi:hypothetical protein
MNRVVKKYKAEVSVATPMVKAVMRHVSRPTVIPAPIMIARKAMRSGM